MKKSDIKTGAILEIPLEKGMGYGYAKLIFSKDVQPNHTDQKIVKVYNLLRKEPIKKEEFHPSQFETDNLAMYPFLMHSFPNMRGEHKWVYKGMANLTYEDHIIPDYLNTNTSKTFNTSSIKDSCTSEYGCAIIRNFEMYRIFTKDFETIKHVGQWSHYSPRAIRTIVTMYWMKTQNRSISDFYTEEEKNSNFWIDIFQNRIEEYDIDFKEINSADRLQPKFNEFIIPGRTKPK